jgi:hypothetical protein
MKKAPGYAPVEHGGNHRTISSEINRVDTPKSTIGSEIKTAFEPIFACCDEECQVQTTIGSEITPVVEYVSKKDTDIRHEDSVIKKAGLTPGCYLFNNVDEGNPSSIVLNVPIQEGVQAH